MKNKRNELKKNVLGNANTHTTAKMYSTSYVPDTCLTTFIISCTHEYRKFCELGTNIIILQKRQIGDSVPGRVVPECALFKSV